MNADIGDGNKSIDSLLSAFIRGYKNLTERCPESKTPKR